MESSGQYSQMLRASGPERRNCPNLCPVWHHSSQEMRDTGLPGQDTWEAQQPLHLPLTGPVAGAGVGGRTPDKSLAETSGGFFG